MPQFTRCKACGFIFEKQANFCPQCGAKNNRPIFTKWWFWVIIILIIGAIGNGGSDPEVDPITTVPTTTQASTSEPTTEATTEATTTPVTEEETLSSAEAAELVMTMIEMSVSDGFDYHKVEGDETGITLSLASDGVAKDVVAAKYSGYDENYKPWAEARTNFVSLCNSIYDSAIEFGMEDPVITLIVLNDQNHDNFLLMITNGVVVYDVMAE